jgi:hypothetical protein
VAVEFSILYGRWQMRMAEFLEGVADRNGLLAVDKEGTNFGLGGIKQINQSIEWSSTNIVDRRELRHWGSPGP